MTNQSGIKKSLKNQYNDICEEYLKEFCKKHDILMNDVFWVGDRVGGIAFIADMYIGIDEIRYDVDNNIEDDKFFKWYWKRVTLAEYNIDYMNYENYCNGCPDIYSDEKISEIAALQRKVYEAKELLEKEIINLKNTKI